MEYRKTVIRVIYASISIAVVAGVMILFVPSGNQVIGKLLGTAISTGVVAGLLLVAIRSYETPMTRPLGTALANANENTQDAPHCVLSICCTVFIARCKFVSFGAVFNAS